MSTLHIITNPHTTLRTKAEKITVEEIPALQGLIKNMKNIMLENDGIGLAANQVDVLKRIIVVNTKNGPLALINPKLSSKSFKKEEAEEGCLSLPDIYGIVRRHKKITVSAYTQDGTQVKLKTTGLFARVIQHEVDHLNGMLFTDRTKKMTKGKIYKTYQQNYQEEPSK